MRISLIAPVAVSLLLVSCVTEKEKNPALPESRIERLVPDKVLAGLPFQQQPNGMSALSIIGKNLVKGSKIKLNGMPLETASGDGTSLAALVPPELFAKEGNYTVNVEMPDGRATNTLTWMVLPKSGPAPTINTLHPDGTAAGKGFNVQATGVSAMGMTGGNFLPGAKIYFDSHELETSFGDTDKLGAVVPKELFQKPGKIKVTVKNPDGKVSAARDFVVSK